MAETSSEPAPAEPTKKPGLLSRIGDQFGLEIFRDYLIPEEANTFWYSIGGIIGISLMLEFLTGFIMLYKYVPDANLAFGITKSLIDSPTWKIVINFHYWNAFLLFGLLMIHMMRVFVSAAYRGAKKGLWFVGVVLAGLMFAAYTSGEALHWDELGFGVPWHTYEILNVFHLDTLFHYTPADLLSIPTATQKLAQLTAVHVAVIPILLIVFVGVHFILIKEKGISRPFWIKPSGRKVPFTSHAKRWFMWSCLLLGAVLLIAAFVPRNAGVAPQLLPSSPYYGKQGDAGDFGYKPSFPIGWTNGMNMILVHFGVDEDIWGTILGMTLMLSALVVVPFLDRDENEPTNAREAFDLKKRGLAFLVMAIFWILFFGGLVSNILAGPG